MAGELQPDRFAPLSFFDGFLNFDEQVLGLFVDGEIAVAGQAEGGGRVDIVQFEQIA